MSRSVVIAVIGLAFAAAAALLALQRAGDEASAPPPLVVKTLPPEAAEKAEAREPSFDVVRIDKEGDAVIAGRAIPKAEVEILDGDAVIGRTIADARGEWVFVPGGPLAPGARELRLRAHNPDGSVTESGAPVVLVVPERGGPALALKPLAGGGAKLLQGPAGGGVGGLSLDLIDHDGRGRLFLGGRAPAHGRVHLYLDNRFLGRADADGEGAWRLSAAGPDGGSHTLRADLVGEKGKVLARVELPYAPGDDVALVGGAQARVVVAPGASLWRIARQAYGSGTAYTVIFSANREQIRNPDLIYPGQVFTMPAR